MKRFFLKLFLAGCLVVALFGCQTPSVVQSQSHNTVVIDKTMVHSFHLGTNANARPYLLIVLNEKGMRTVQAIADKGKSYDIMLDGHAYQQSAQVNTGFLVLYPAADEWNNERLTRLLK